jgi:cell pole-organizing protein PopZ
MSSTERAPEPTMEEILASIRRIITDDEAGQASAEKPAKKAQAEDESLEGEADNQIIDDIARVLSGGGEAPASEEEEILDLTAELGGLELVEDDDEPVLEITEVTEIEVLELEDAEPVFEPDAEMSDAAFAEDVTPEFVEEPAQEMPPPPPQMAAPEPPMPPQPQPQAQAPAPAPAAPPAPEPVASAGEEAASALERAIAALRAGQVPTSTTPQAEPFQFQAAPQPEAMTASEPGPEMESEPLPMAVPMDAPEPAEETHPEFGAQSEPEAYERFEAQPDTAPVIEPLDDFMDEPEDESFDEPELVLAEVEETVAFVEPEQDDAEPEAPPFWPAQASEEQPAEPEPETSYEPEPEPVLTQTNGIGGHHAEGPSRTLEDSIKDMLRPMLREWLDDNMPRIIRDELDTESLRGRQD